MTDPLQPASSRRSRFRVDTAVLRDVPDFRRIWWSGLVTYLGSIATYVALPFQIKELTGSVALAGLLGAAELLPMVVFGLWGRALADAVDRRKMAVATEIGLLLMTGLLLLNALTPTPRVWPIFIVAGLFAVADSLQRPCLDALIAAVVPVDRMAAASALASIRYQVGGILGPALAGVLLTVVGTWSAFAFDVATTAISVLILSRVRHLHVPRAAGDVVSLRGISAGLRYAAQRTDLLGTYLIDILAMVFGMTVALYPFLVVVMDAPWALGLLYAAEAVGALLVSVTSGWTAHVHHHGRAITYAAVAFGPAMICVGLAPNIWVALVAVVAAGAADMVSGIFRSTIWNQSVPDELRGRLAGIELISYSTGPIAGNARAGVVASLTSVRASIISGGIVVVVATLITGLRIRTLWTYDDRTQPEVQAKRAVRGGQ